MARQVGTSADSMYLEAMGEGGAKILRIPLRTMLCLGDESIMVSERSGVFAWTSLLAAAWDRCKGSLSGLTLTEGDLRQLALGLLMSTADRILRIGVGLPSKPCLSEVLEDDKCKVGLLLDTGEKSKT